MSFSNYLRNIKTDMVDIVLIHCWFMDMLVLANKQELTSALCDEWLGQLERVWKVHAASVTWWRGKLACDLINRENLLHNGYHCRKWSKVQILDKVFCISHSASTLGNGTYLTVVLQLWVNGRADWAL